jgi:hypothetical protein
MTAFPKMIYRATGETLERLVVNSAAEMEAKAADGWGAHEAALEAIAAYKIASAAMKADADAAHDPEALKAALAEKDAVIEKLESLIAEQKGLIKALKEQVKAEASPKPRKAPAA